MFELAPALPSRNDLDWCWYLRRQGRVGEALERALHDIGVMQPGGWAHWDNSTMTDIGAPTEMLFVANRTSLSLRTEVENPAKDPTGRVATACNLIAQFGGTTPPGALRDVISAAQGAGTLHFGAWLGLKSCPKGLATTLYAEIPADASDLKGLMLSDKIKPVLSELGNDARITMLSYDSCNGEVTLFCETDENFATVIPKLTEPAEVPSEPLVFEMGIMLNDGIPGAHETSRLGFSYTLHNDESPPTLALQVNSKSVFETDAVIIDRVKSYPGDHVAAYSELADELSQAPQGKIHHGAIGFLARRTRGPLLSIGVAAPWYCPFESI